MRLEDALLLAMEWQAKLAPFCERIEIAGSVRRCKAEVHDIELVAIPQTTELVEMVDLFSQRITQVNLLEQAIWSLAQAGDHFTLLKNGPRMKQLKLSQGITLDLFIVLPPAQWGVIFTLRTGPADLSHWLVTKKSFGGGLPSYLKVRDGVLWNGDQAINTPEEADFFREIGVEMVSPVHRSAPVTWRKG